jgi:hypothetical protein
LNLAHTRIFLKYNNFVYVSCFYRQLFLWIQVEVYKPDRMFGSMRPRNTNSKRRVCSGISESSSFPAAGFKVLSFAETSRHYCLHRTVFRIKVVIYRMDSCKLFILCHVIRKFFVNMRVFNCLSLTILHNNTVH